MKIGVCCGKKCTERGSAKIIETLKEFFESKKEVVIDCRGCTGYCEQGPNVVVDDILIYHEAKAKDIGERIKRNEGKIMIKIKPEDLNLDDLI